MPVAVLAAPVVTLTPITLLGAGAGQKGVVASRGRVVLPDVMSCVLGAPLRLDGRLEQGAALPIVLPVIAACSRG